MDMNSLIHPPAVSADSALRGPPFASTGLPGLPGLRTHHFPSLPIRLPVFQSAPPADNHAMSSLQDHRHRAPPTLAPLRFIIPSSHCSSTSSMNMYSSNAVNSSEPVNNYHRSAASVTVKAEPEHELEPSSQNYAQVVSTSGHQMSHHVEKQERQYEEQDARHDADETVNGFALQNAEGDLKSKEQKKAASKRTRVVKNSNRSTKSKARPGLRKGKWTDEESKYATQLTNYFKEGLLPIERGTMLRLYLSQKLNCEPMRITKKFTGGECIGKQVFRPCSPTPESRVRLMQAQLELVALEAAFIKKLKENREEAPGSMDDNDSGSSTSHKKRGSKSGNNGGSSSEDDEGFTSDSSTSSTPSFGHKVSSSTKNASSTKNEEDDADNANAVGLLLDFFYKANRNEKSDTATKCSSSLAVDSGDDRSFANDNIVNSPTKRIRALSISNYVGDDSLTKRSRVGSFTTATVFAK
uniref:Uncharacterized protein n=1 Tax=Globisporangium ultimum (strain ATCC 200006 / CBS 805.95 / DAOM BR144) TaxID=431595 RepID=K3W864_GLOUD